MSADGPPEGWIILETEVPGLGTQLVQMPEGICEKSADLAFDQAMTEGEIVALLPRGWKDDPSRQLVSVSMFLAPVIERIRSRAGAHGLQVISGGEE